MGTLAMKLVIAVALATLALGAAAKSAPTSAFTYGHAAYTYGPLHCVSDPCSVVPSCNKAHWAQSISDFNTDTSISESITALLDARMDGWDMITQYNNYDACDFGDFYPNLNNLTDPQIEHLGQYTAELYCHDDNLGGIQVDLEPYQDPYKESLEKFVTALATNMKDDSGANGCKNDAHPFGRTTSYFTFAHRMRKTFYNESMGDNGIYVFSGYDLKPKNLAFEYNNVSEFAAK